MEQRTKRPVTAKEAQSYAKNVLEQEWSCAVKEIGGPERIGAFTGLYYTATQSAAIFGPVAVGRMFDVTAKFTADGAPNYWSLFVFCPVCFILALTCMVLVRHGETDTISRETIREIRSED